MNYNDMLYIYIHITSYYIINMDTITYTFTFADVWDTQKTRLHQAFAGACWKCLQCNWALMGFSKGYNGKTVAYA